MPAIRDNVGLDTSTVAESSRLKHSKHSPSPSWSFYHRQGQVAVEWEPAGGKDFLRLPT